MLKTELINGNYVTRNDTDGRTVQSQASGPRLPAPDPRKLKRKRARAARKITRRAL